MSRSPFGVFLALVLVTAAPAWGKERVALLMGNADYTLPSLDLANPVNDVLALADVLQRNGFAVTTLADQPSQSMRHAVETFADSALGAEIALVFYAGHGTQVANDNYLIGTDFSVADIADVRPASVGLNWVLAELGRARADLTVLIVDACRDTPFSAGGLVPPGLRRAAGGSGTLIAYATDPGNVALDGHGENSVFTAALLEHIDTPGLDVRLMFGRVRQQVVIETMGAQVPWVEEAVIGEHVLSTQAPPAAKITASEADELRAWRNAEASGTPRAYRAFMAAHPEGLFAEIAAERLGALTAASDLPGADVVDLAGASPAAITAALSTLGLGPADMRSASPEAVARHFAAYRARQSVPGSVRPEDLFRDAGQTAAFLAGSTAQRLRTDVTALRSVERTLGIAEEALAGIEDLAATNPAAAPILAQARSDVGAIRDARAGILERLDLTRGYYADLLDAAATFLTADVRADLLAGQAETRSGRSAPISALEDAARFLDHVDLAQRSPTGSYQWLTDFLSGV